MNAPYVLLGAILILGVLYVIVPVALETLVRFRRARNVECPGTGRNAVVEIDARHAAWTSAFGKPKIRVTDCSHWPERSYCDRECEKQIV